MPRLVKQVMSFDVVAANDMTLQIQNLCDSDVLRR